MNALAYSDDLILVADSLNHLENLYDILDQGIKDLRLTINKYKSKCMILSGLKKKEFNNRGKTWK